MECSLFFEDLVTKSTNTADPTGSGTLIVLFCYEFLSKQDRLLFHDDHIATRCSANVILMLFKYIKTSLSECLQFADDPLW